MTDTEDQDQFDVDAGQRRLAGLLADILPALPVHQPPACEFDEWSERARLDWDYNPAQDQTPTGC